jgi:hypothetical protein
MRGLLARLLTTTAAPTQPTPSKNRAADQCRREKQDTRLFARAADLAPWLISIDEADRLSYRRLCALYHEFCDLRDLQPLSELRFSRELKAAGILRYAAPARARAIVRGAIACSPPSFSNSRAQRTRCGGSRESRHIIRRASTAFRKSRSHEGATTMVKTYENGAEAEADRQQQRSLLKALRAWERALRRDECGAWRIAGTRGTIHTWGDGKTWVRRSTGPGRRKP